MTNVLTGAERFIAQWRQSTAEGNLYSPDDLTAYILGIGVVPGNGRQVSTLATYLLNNAVFNVKDFGAKGDGITDDTAVIQAAITAATAGGMIYFPRGAYLVTSTLQVNVPHLTFRGEGINVSSITCTSAGASIQLGTDNGLPYTNLLYDGIADGFTFQDLYIHYSGATDTAGANGNFNYKAGTYGIRDWRGGSVRLTRARIVGYNYGFWGVQSDLNVWNDLTFESNHVGAYFGPASDQLSALAIYSIGNDIMWQLQGCGGGTVVKWTSDCDGSSTTCPCEWGNYNDGAGHTRPAYRWDFYSPWFERIGSLPVTVAIEAWFKLGSGDTAAMNDAFGIHYPMARTNFWNTAGLPRANYLVSADHLKCVVINGPSAESGLFATNLKAVIKVVNNGAATTVPLIRYLDGDGENINFIENYSATTVNAVIDGFQSTTYGTNVNGGTGAVSLSVSPLTSAPTLTGTTSVIGGAAVAGSTARFQGDATATTGHAVDIAYTAGARYLVNVNATEAALLTQNAFPLYLGVNNGYKWQVANQVGISALFPLEALAYISCGTNGLSVRNNAGGRDNLKVDDSGTVLAFGAMGYQVGVGGTVTQATSKVTGVTLNKVTGQITMNAAALAAGTIVSFVLTNSAIKNPDLLILNHVSGGTPGSYSLNARVTADGSATIDVRNNTGGSLSEAIVIGYTIMRGQTA